MNTSKPAVVIELRSDPVVVVVVVVVIVTPLA